MSLRFATMFVLISLTARLNADEPKSNPFRDGTGKGVPDVTKPRSPAAVAAARAEIDASIRKFEDKWHQRELEMLEIGLQTELFQKQFELGFRQRPLHGVSATMKLEARIRAEEVFQQAKRDAMATQLRQHLADETKFADELKRLKALPEKPEPGVLRAARERLEEARQQLVSAKFELTTLEEAHLAALAQLKSKLDLEREGDDKIHSEIDATRTALARVRMQLLDRRYGIEDKGAVQSERILKELKQLREEVKQLREQK